MKSGFSDAYMLALGSVQIGVWKDCFRVLQEQLPSFNKKYPSSFNLLDDVLNGGDINKKVGEYKPEYEKQVEEINAFLE